ncbi:hypothetical protein K3495_g4006 [Podosphaera aphanis]|nr:hypothetical protein K3495_g4006 [Podosphaera aphanis]
MHLDQPLRETIDESAPGTTLEQFTNTILRKQPNWFDKFPPRGTDGNQYSRPSYKIPESYYQPQQRQRDQQRQLGYNNSSNSEGRYQRNQSNQPYISNPYTSYGQNQNHGISQPKQGNNSRNTSNT